MNIKSILLGTAAGLMVASAAQAADLPGEVVPAAVDYVKVCDAFGAGFFYIPGTETCLDISGRVRFRLTVGDGFTSTGLDDDFAPVDGDDDFGYQFRADARVSFDARTATEYGTLRSFFRLLIDDGSNSIYTDAAYIQFSYLTVGYFTALYSYDATLGDINSFDLEYTDAVGVQVLVDDIGGGFFLGAGLFDPVGGRTRSNFGDFGAYDIPEVSITAGIEGQPWGGISIVGTWIDDANEFSRTVVVDGVEVVETASAVNRFGVSTETWAVRAVADLTLIDGVDIKLTAAYIDAEDEFSKIPLSAGVSFDATDSLSLYTGIRYDIVDEDDAGDDDDEDQLRAQVGAVYTITEGLKLTGEVAYVDVGDDDDDDQWAAYLQLRREW